MYERFQSYLRAIAHRWQTAIALPPFTLFINFLSDSHFANYALPDLPVGGDVRGALAALRVAFGEHNRQPRIEYVHEFAPELADALRAAGWVEESRVQLMVCALGDYRQPADVPGLVIRVIDADSPLAVVQSLVEVQRQVFEPERSDAVTEHDAHYFLDGMGGGRAFLAVVDGEAVGAGGYNPPLDGIAEVAGIATMAAYRRRGIATVLAAEATSAAFARGVEVVFLTAADERAGRIYTRIGYVPQATVLTFVAPLDAALAV